MPYTDTKYAFNMTRQFLYKNYDLNGFKLNMQLKLNYYIAVPFQNSGSVLNFKRSVTFKNFS